jgi:1,4-dihydroxy-2-naphthoate polyprenyltransferase
MRLRTLPLALAGILTGGGLALSVGAMRWNVFAMAVLTAILLQILSNLSNDLGDSLSGVDNPDRIGPKRAVQQGLISRPAMKRGVVLTAFMALISGLWFLHMAAGDFNAVFFGFLGAGLASIAAALGYTLGKKPYGYMGLGDVFVLLFFGLVAVLGSAFLISGTIETLWIPAALSMGCIAAAVLNLNNMRDIENDRAHGKRTLAVKLGLERAKVYQALLLTVAFGAWIGLMVIQNRPLLWLSVMPFLVLAIHLKRVFSTGEPRSFDPELKKVALTGFLISLLFMVLTAVG